MVAPKRPLRPCGLSPRLLSLSSSLDLRQQLTGPSLGPPANFGGPFDQALELPAPIENVPLIATADPVLVLVLEQTTMRIQIG